MLEADRRNRNLEKLQECHPVFGGKVAQILVALQLDSWRPRIQCAYRSEDDQLEALHSGYSKLSWGYHCAASPEGKPESLAVDILDDNDPLNPSHDYLFALARAAWAVDLNTGILWGLPLKIQRQLYQHVVEHWPWPNTLGFDPTHVEWVGLTVEQVKAGERPNNIEKEQ